MASGAPGAREATPTIEVTLTSGRAPSGAEPSDGAPPEPNWRRVVGIAALVGVALGIAVAIVVLGSDGDETDDEPAPTSPEITTPPTLTPLADLPAPDFATRRTLSTAPQGTTSQTRDLFDSPSPRPAYPIVATVPDSEADRYRLLDAVAELEADVARRSTTRLEIGAAGYVLETRITRDPVNDRYEVVVYSNAVFERLIVDVPGGRTYLDDGIGSWTLVDSPSLARSLGVPEMQTFVEQLLLGPIRPDTIGGALRIGSRPGALVDLGGGLLAQAHTIELPAAAAPEWAEYALGPSGDAPPVAADEEIEYSVYVTRDGNVRRVVGVAPRGTTSQLVVHDLVRLPIPVSVELPAAETVVDVADTTEP